MNSSEHNSILSLFDEEEEHPYLKASEMNKVREELVKLSMALVFLIFTYGLLFVTLTSLFIWQINFTLFISIISAGLAIFSTAFYMIARNEMAKQVKKIKTRISETKENVDNE